MLENLAKAPFPYFGGKSAAAEHVWTALGDPAHYVEPFCGSCAVLLLRPHECNRPYGETINDKDGLLCNFWRAIQTDPDATAEAASWPVSECGACPRGLARAGVLAMAPGPWEMAEFSNKTEAHASRG